MSGMSGRDYGQALELGEKVTFSGPDQPEILRRAADWYEENACGHWHVAAVAPGGFPGHWSLVLYLEPSRVPAPAHEPF